MGNFASIYSEKMDNSDFNTKRRIRDLIYLFSAYCFIIVYLPHIFCFFVLNKNIIKDVRINKRAWDLCFGDFNSFLYLLHSNKYFRSLFYYRIGVKAKLLISWVRPGCSYFIVSPTTQIGEGLCLVHPYATTINANSIGTNFKINCCTTIGSKNGMYDRPTIGDNVALGANVNIIGGVNVGNNVTIGAGSVVVQNIPDNCIVAGNPAKVIRYKV